MPASRSITRPSDAGTGDGIQVNLLGHSRGAESTPLKGSGAVRLETRKIVDGGFGSCVLSTNYMTDNVAYECIVLRLPQLTWVGILSIDVSLHLIKDSSYQEALSESLPYSLIYQC